MLNPIKPGITHNRNVSKWRKELKEKLYYDRGGRSDFSGKVLNGCHMHEGIISRAVVPRTVWWHFMIFVPVNCFLLLPEEHTPQPPSREWAIEYSYEMYGREIVREWFYGLPWKSKPHFELS